MQKYGQNRADAPIFLAIMSIVCIKKRPHTHEQQRPNYNVKKKRPANGRRQKDFQKALPDDPFPVYYWAI